MTRFTLLPKHIIDIPKHDVTYNLDDLIKNTIKSIESELVTRIACVDHLEDTLDIFLKTDKWVPHNDSDYGEKIEKSDLFISNKIVCDTREKQIIIDVSHPDKRRKVDITKQCSIVGCKNRGFRNKEYSHLQFCNPHRYRIICESRYIKRTVKDDTTLIWYKNGDEYIGPVYALYCKNGIECIIRPCGEKMKILSLENVYTTPQ